MRSFMRSGVKKDVLRTLPEAVSSTVFQCPAWAAAGLPPPAHRNFPAPFGVKDLDDFVRNRSDNTTFTFLSIFKWEERKNWRALIDTFWKTFPHEVTQVGREDGTVVNLKVRLLIKTQELAWSSSPTRDMQDELSSRDIREEAAKSRVLIIKERLTTEQIARLYQVGDAFVLPTHGEGWGLPLVEAMASGLPTIATGWGGQMDFMSKSNSWPLDYTLAPAPVQEGFGLMQSLDDSPQWADVDEAGLRGAMWEVTRGSPDVRMRVAQACKDIHSRFSPETVAASVDALVAQLHDTMTVSV
mmetsp:Transcript_26008/g.73000  ORF Transcript_26008/g.73000 Transcript_26008/m.73000 type:complete len:299 (-) Transcript_26008:321-1217(-)